MNISINDLENAGPSVYMHDIGDQLKSHIYKRSEVAFALGDSARDAVTSAEQLETRQRLMRASFIDSFGGLPPSDWPLNARVVGTIECNGFRIEKIIFESRPQTFITANLYVPNHVNSPQGAVLFLCGHSDQAKHYGEYQTVCRYLVKSGLVVLTQDPVGQGERLSYFEKAIGDVTVHWGTREHEHTGNQCWLLGDGIARYFVHDAMRGVDYLLTRPEVDPNKIGVTGCSGGGTQTCLMMICDPRIAAAAPAAFVTNRQSYMYTGEAQDAEQIWPGMTALGFDHEDTLLMMAPRPVKILAATQDFFPIEGTRRTVARCRRFWEMLGYPDHLEIFEDDCTHQYSRPMAKAAAEFFSKHLLGREITPLDDDIEPLPPSQLWCTKSGQIRGDFDNARAVYEENQDRLSNMQNELALVPADERKKNVLEWLRERVFLHRKLCDLNPKFYNDAHTAELVTQECSWWSQEDIVNYGILLRDFHFAGQDLPVTLAVWDGGTNCIRPHMKWIRETCASGRAVLILDMSGIGSLEPNKLNSEPKYEPKGVFCKFSHDLMWLDDSLAAMRVYDVVRALDLIEAYPGLDASDICCYAHGRYGTYMRLAALLDERMKNLRVVDGQDSFAEMVQSRNYENYDVNAMIIPSILKHMDLPDADEWLAAEHRLG
ncbi:MAG: prolyl oligopeptidase family serine peptidase [Armatimonadota bacterium]|nr:prolyl oligopeptidase family serine peptidase [bacterium]